MPENDFLPFAVGSSANVEAQSTYAADAILQSGFQSGVANSAQVNKVLRQASIIMSMIADFIVSETGQPAIDNGTTSTLQANFGAAVTVLINAFVANALGVGGTIYTPQFASVIADAIDANGGGGQLRLVGGNYGLILRNDGSTLNVLVTPAGQPMGGFGALRPLNINLATGVVTIDSTGAGTNFGGTIAAQSAVIVNNANVEGQLAAGSMAIAGSATIAGALSVPQIGSTYFTGAPYGPTPANGTRTNQLATTAMFANEFPLNLNGTGYTKLPNGLILQWGFAVLVNGLATVTFALAFPNYCFGIVSNDVGSSGSSNDNVTSCSLISLSQFSAFGRSSAGSLVSTNMFFMAVGF